MCRLRYGSWRAALLVALCSAPAVNVLAYDVPRLIRYQGTLTDAQGQVLPSPATLTFRLYAAATGGAPLWQETQTNVTLTSGQFSVLLGEVTPLIVTFTQDLWLGVEANGNGEMAPRQRLTTVPYTFRAQDAAQLGGGAVIVDSANNVGIGTSAPAAKLQVHFASPTTNPLNLDNGLVLRNTDTTAGNLAGVILDTENAANQRRNAVLSQNGNLLFMNHDTGGHFFTAMTLANGGNLGIGTTAPALHVSLPSVTLTDNLNGITWYDPSPYTYGIYRTAGAWQAPAYQQLRIQWETGLILDPGSAYAKSYVAIPRSHLVVEQGGVGIGVVPNYPTHKLDVNGRIRLRQGSDSSAGLWLYQTQSAGDRAFIGMLSDTKVGFYGATGAGWGLLMDTTTGRIGLGVADPQYPIHVASGAHVTAGGVWTNASSRAFKQDIAALPLAAARATLRALEPVTFRYKAAPEEAHVGFIAEDVPDLVATRDRTSLSPMDIVAVLTKVVQAQAQELASLRARVEALEHARPSASDGATP